MPLTHEEKKTLQRRYEMWGAEAVRRELRNPQRATFTSPEVDEFAYSWLAEQEMKASGRSDRLVKLMMIVAGIEFGVLVGQNISSWLLG